MSAMLSLLLRELKRFYRKPSRVIGVFGFPLIFWLILGLGFQDLFELNGQSYLTYFFPGSLVLVILFTSIFQNIGLIEDRHQGFLQGVLVSPARSLWIALGKILGGTALGTFQGLLLAPVLWVLTGLPTLEQFVAVCFGISLSAFALSALGFVFAWCLDSVQGFHSVMNLILLPMWILSGAIFPPSGAIGSLMAANPLFYGLTLIRGGEFSLQCVLVLVSLGLVCVGLSVQMMNQKRGIAI